MLTVVLAADFPLASVRMTSPFSPAFAAVSTPAVTAFSVTVVAALPFVTVVVDSMITEEVVSPVLPPVPVGAEVFCQARTG